ncbi:hypothetical protein JZ751_009642 [Albula glossodonta]|uniref:Uncharacterized protein n=1 Tax=Albula glossodonta TaxID=121402 RepID=A0A8T2P161_9TELE|nr:hypothetical protein JZ751_009642 [Albula glossodonta]
MSHEKPFTCEAEAPEAGHLCPIGEWTLSMDQILFPLPSSVLPSQSVCSVSLPPAGHTELMSFQTLWDSEAVTTVLATEQRDPLQLFKNRRGKKKQYSSTEFLFAMVSQGCQATERIHGNAQSGDL